MLTYLCICPSPSPPPPPSSPSPLLVSCPILPSSTLLCSSLALPYSALFSSRVRCAPLTLPSLPPFINLEARRQAREFANFAVTFVCASVFAFIFTCACVFASARFPAADCRISYALGSRSMLITPCLVPRLVRVCVRVACGTGYGYDMGPHGDRIASHGTAWDHMR